MIKLLISKISTFDFSPFIYLMLISGLSFSVQIVAHDSHPHNEIASVNAEVVLFEVTKHGPQIKKLNLGKGTSQVLYSIPKGDKLYQLEHAPDKPELLLSYLKHATGQQGIWKLSYTPETEDSTVSELTPIVVDKDPSTWFFDPLYHVEKIDKHKNATHHKNSAQQKGRFQEKTHYQKEPGSIYFISARIDEKTLRASKDLTLKHLDLTSQEQTVIAKNARYPRVSNQGNYLSWIESINGTNAFKILDINNNQNNEFPIANPKLKVRFARINELHRSLFFFTNQQQLTARSFIEEISDFEYLNFLDNLSFFKKAWAHTGHKHRDYYGWQLPLDESSNTTAIQDAQMLWQIEDVRAFDLSDNGKYAAWVNTDGLSIVDIQTKKPLFSRKNPNFWKLRWVPRFL